MEPIPVDLSGGPQTLLWNLGRRAAAARTAGSLLDDPLATEVTGRLEYDFGDASRGARWHAVRVAAVDSAVRRFLREHPAGTYFQRAEVHQLIAAIAAMTGVAGIADLVPPTALGAVPVTLRAVRLLPRRVRYALPVFPVLQVRFR